MLDQNVTCADIFWPEKRRTRKSRDLFFRQPFRWVPDGLLRRRVEKIWHLARVGEANFPARLQVHKYSPPQKKKKKQQSVLTYHTLLNSGVQYSQARERVRTTEELLLLTNQVWRDATLKSRGHDAL